MVILGIFTTHLVTHTQAVKLAECEIYSYNPNSDADPSIERGAMYVFLSIYCLKC